MLNFQAMDLLLSKGAELENSIYYAAKEGHNEAVQWLIDHGADVNMQNTIGLTLFTATSEGDSIDH